jgi:hypothetical protein
MAEIDDCAVITVARIAVNLQVATTLEPHMAQRYRSKLPSTRSWHNSFIPLFCRSFAFGSSIDMTAKMKSSCRRRSVSVGSSAEIDDSPISSSHEGAAVHGLLLRLRRRNLPNDRATAPMSSLSIK